MAETCIHIQLIFIKELNGKQKINIGIYCGTERKAEWQTEKYVNQQNREFKNEKPKNQQKDS